MQKALAVHHPETAAGFFFRKSFGDESGAKIIGDARARGTSAEKNDLLIAKRRASNANGGEDGAQCNGGCALNVVVESEHLIAVAIENGASVDAGKVFPLEKCCGKNLFDCRDEGVDEAVVIGAGDARVAPAEIFGIAQALLVVGADIQNDG